MNKFLIACAIAAGSLGTIAQAQAADVRVNIYTDVTPGVYGRINIGDSHPQLVYNEPVIITRSAYPVEPLYLHVPPGHAKKWSKHCARYHACGRPVYFVRSPEYDAGYRPAPRPRAYVQPAPARVVYVQPRYGYDRDDKHDKHDKHGKGDKGEKHGKGHGKD